MELLTSALARLSMKQKPPEPTRRSKRRHLENFPPQEYTDLTRSDCRSLAHILGNAGGQGCSITNNIYARTVKQLVSELPSHLRCEYPRLSKFCSLHNKINLFVVKSVFDAMRADIEQYIPRTFNRMRQAGSLNALELEMLEVIEDISALWTPTADFLKKYERPPKYPRGWTEHNGKCEACILSYIGGDFQAIIALGGFVIGRLSESAWSKSRRIWWYEAWVTDCVVTSKQGNAIAMMWHFGRSLKETKQAARRTAPASDAARASCSSPQEEEPVQQEWPARMSSRDWRSPPSDTTDSRQASSWTGSSEASTSSRYARPGLQRSQPVALRRDPDASSHVRPMRNSELAKYPRQMMAPVTLPRDNPWCHGSIDRWNYRVQSRIPAFRIGKNGELKGPFDSVSDADEGSYQRWISADEKSLFGSWAMRCHN